MKNSKIVKAVRIICASILLSVLVMPSANASETMPAQQKKFLEIIKTGVQAYKDAKTDLKSSAALRKRDRAACAVLSSNKATNWVGTIKDIGANREGKAYIQIELDSGIRVQTWNNSFSDLNDNTLIPEGSKVYNAIIDGDEGSKIIFSAQFLKDDNSCLKGSNLTEYFYATDPKFIVKITGAKLAK